MASEKITLGVHHVGLTVPDVARSRDFFTDTLGFDLVREDADYPAAFVSDGAVMITLWQAQNPETAVAFDRKRVIGLHHVALRVADAAALATLLEKLKALPDVVVEFPPESLRGSATKHMMCYMPGGIRCEFIAPA